MEPTIFQPERLCYMISGQSGLGTPASFKRIEDFSSSCAKFQDHAEHLAVSYPVLQTGNT
jgi:hypothetical protein